MDDIFEKLSDILSTDEGQEQLKNLASMFSLGDSEDNTVTEPKAEQTSASMQTSDNIISPDVLLKIAPIISKLNSSSSNKNTQLIYAIKPYLKPENSHRADEAAQILRLLEILPTLKDNGLF